MKWKQDLEIKPIPVIHHDSVITSIGSCFSSNIGNYLKQRHFNVSENPMGILFNPVSIEMMISRALERKPYSEKDLTHHLGMYHMVGLHGSCQDHDPDELIQRVNILQEGLAEHLRRSDVLLLTLGTSIVFKFLPSGFIAGNNHKLPLEQFDRQILTITEVRGSIVQMIRAVRKHNPGIKVLLTVSPVRHLRNGSVLNQLSKSTLIVACHDIEKEFSEVHYFPAYEIMMDELRDYRFYAEDLIHPSEQAVTYIWERFVEAHFTPKAKVYLKDVDQLNAMERHRPLFPESNEHKNFLYKLSTLKKQVVSQWNINLPEQISE